MALDLREYFGDWFGLNIGDDIVDDKALTQSWNSSVKFWLLYRVPEQTQVLIEVPSSGEYTFVDPIPKTISLNVITDEGCIQPLPCSQVSYIPPTLFAPEGRYLVKYDKDLTDLTQITEEDVNEHLETLFMNTVKRKVGQFFKFTDFTDHPFQLDGEQIYQEAETEIKDKKEFIWINRDERFSNLSSF